MPSIGDYAFNNCINLESITIPNSVTSIGDYAFLNCINLESITIPNSVTSIGHDAFYGCDKLASVTLPNSVKSIGAAAFEHCESLASVTIPNSVTSIEKSAFANCKNLEKVNSKLANPFAISDETFDSDTYSKATLYVPKGSVAQYKATDGWKNFKNIVEEDSITAINDVEADNTLDTSKGIYDINGKRLPATSLDELPSGMYIVNGKKVVK